MTKLPSWEDGRGHKPWSGSLQKLGKGTDCPLGPPQGMESWQHLDSSLVRPDMQGGKIASLHCFKPLSGG